MVVMCRTRSTSAVPSTLTCVGLVSGSRITCQQRPKVKNHTIEVTPRVQRLPNTAPRRWMNTVTNVNNASITNTTGSGSGHRMAMMMPTTNGPTIRSKGARAMALKNLSAPVTIPFRR